MKKLFVILALFFSAASFSQTKLIVPAGPGGLLHRVAMDIQPQLQSHLNDTVVIEFRPGAQGIVGYREFQSSKGRTFLLSAPQDWMREAKDLIPVHYFGTITGLIITSKSEIKNIRDAKSYGVPGNSANVGMMRKIGGMIEVPYKSGSEILAATIGGHIDIGVTTVDGSMSAIEAGKVRPIAVFAYRRSEKLPDVPTLKEAGIQIKNEERHYNNIFLFSNESMVVPKLVLNGQDVQTNGQLAPLMLEKFLALE